MDLDALKQKLRPFATRQVILSALGLGVLFIAASAFALYRYLPPQSSEDPAAALTWIPGPSNTPAPTGTFLSTSTATATIAPLGSGEMGIGSFVQIVGTEGAGLNIRSQPGLSSGVGFLGYDAEVFEVRDGPQQIDGLTWWYVVTPVDESRAGWAAASYLSVVANP